MDKKAVFFTMLFGTSSRQAIGVTRKLPLPFGLYLLLDVWCILGDKHISNQCLTRMRILFPISPIAFRAKYKTFFHWATGKMFYIFISFI